MANQTNTSWWKKFFNFISFIALAMIGVALIIAKLASGVAGALTFLATVIAYIIVAFYAFFYAFDRRRSTVSLIIHVCIWVVSVVLIIVFVILGKSVYF